MREFINRLIERLYYWRFPDRVNDHKIATTSIEIPTVKEVYRPRTICNVQMLSKAEYKYYLDNNDNLKDFEYHLKKMIYRNIEDRAIPFINLEVDKGVDKYDPYVMIRGELTLFEREEG